VETSAAVFSDETVSPVSRNIIDSFYSCQLFTFNKLTLILHN